MSDRRIRAGIALALIALGCGGGRTPAERARATIAQTLASLGGTDAFRAFGPVVMFASGTQDKGVEGQGKVPGQPTRGRYRETLALDARTGRAAWQYREDRPDGTWEWFGEAYPTDGRRLYVVYEAEAVVPFRSATFARDRARLFRRPPQLLLEELRGADDLTELDGADGERRLRGTLASGDTVTVTLRGDPLRVTAARFAAWMSGREAVTWHFDDYRPIAGLGRLPYQYGVTVGGRPYTQLHVDSVLGGGDAVFEAPPTFRVVPEIEVDTANAADAPGALELEPVGGGAYIARGVRDGFDPMVVEFANFVVAVDAPSSFPLLTEMPPGETDPGPSVSWSAERYVDAIRRTFPGKALRYVVLTHAHADHAGGVRAFVAAGATVLASPSLRPGVEELLHVPSEDRYASAPRPLAFEPVEHVRVIEDSTQRLEIMPVGDNPHAEGMLVLNLPRVGGGAMFVSDLVTFEPLKYYPRPNHVALDRFFRRWLHDRGLRPKRIYPMHGGGALTPEHLAELG